MFDNDTLIVTYDQERGEPRSDARGKVDAKSLALVIALIAASAYRSALPA